MGPRSTMSGWSYVSAPLPGWEWEGLLQAILNIEGQGGTLSLFYESTPQPTEQEPSTPGTGLALGVIRSAHPLLHRSIAGLHCFQEFLSVPLVRYGLESLSTLGGDVTQHLVWTYAKKALGLAKLFIWGLEPSRSVPHQVPWLEPTTNLQMSKSAGLYYCLDTAGMNSICQDPCVGCCKLLPSFLSQSDF